MSTVDNRVVQMQFDNGSFEAKLGETMRSIAGLKTSLDFSNSQKNISDLETAGKNFSMGNMGGAVDGISAKFLALATVGVTALATITAKVVEAGLAFGKSFTVGPIMEGFKEFETNMGSIQTILANTQSKGSTLDDVNKALADLNTYSDKTIYNFSQMARNIGTFTAAGVDLKTSTESIKGISNLAALSGSNAEQASTAMYQLSQAMASGSVKLMDWNSVVNAGMGGETFQKSLFESGKAMKTLTNVPAGQTFEEWKKAGNSFRDSLQDGWITGKVLTNTLKTFTGDMSVAQIQAMGYTKQQAEEMFKMGETGLKAATQVKTLTQLIGTVKESVGSGWTQTFQTLFGNFDESVALFTGINNAIGKVVGANADARNELLNGWKDLGGRTLLIQAFKDGFAALGAVLKAIKAAFREIFPAKTSQDLMNFTSGFADLMKSLMPGPETLSKLKSIFAGLFSVLSIGKEIIKGVFSVIGGLIGGLSGAGGGVLTLAANFGDFLVYLNEVLVKGGAIRDFFVKVSDAISVLSGFLKDVASGIFGFLSSFLGVGETSGAVDQLSRGFDRLGDAGKGVASIGERISKGLEAVKTVLSGVGQYIKTWLSELGGKMADALGPEDFNGVVDVVGVGLLGGLVIMFKKFLSGGLKLDFGGGMFEKIKGALDGVTGTLKSMQTELKARALMEIAIALGVLTASIFVLSTINSGDLAKSLTAMTISFAALIGTMTAMDKVIGSAGSAAKLGIVAAAMILVAGAMLILSGAIKILSTIDPGDLATGLAGLAGAMTIMVGAAKFMSTDAKGMIAGGIAMMAMATAMNILALAVKSFAEMSAGDMVKGLTGVGISLGLVTVAMNLMSGPHMIAAGLGMIGVATGLRILTEAVDAFSKMSWTDLAKGFVAIGVGLGIIAVAMNLMPITLPITAAGLILVGLALIVIAKAVSMMAENDLGELAKGIGAFAIMLGVIVVAVNAMSGALAGAAALIVVAGAMLILTHVLKVLGGMSLTELAIGLGAIIAVLIAFGIAGLVMGPVIPVLLGLGIALGAIGIAFALFGVGAFLAAKAFEVVAKAGKVGVEVLIDMIILFIKALPRMVMALVDSFAEMAGSLIKATGTLLVIIKVFLIQVLDTVIELIPKIVEAVVVLLLSVLAGIRKVFPVFVQTGIELLLNLLTGIRDNIYRVITLAVDIVVNFAKALTDNADKLVNAAVDLLIAFVDAIAARVGDIITAGFNLLLALIKGITDNWIRIVWMVGDLITEFIKAIDGSLQKIIDAGGTLIVNFIKGLGTKMIEIADAATDVISKFIQAIADNAVELANAAGDALVDFLEGMAEAIRTHSKDLRDAGLDIALAIADGMTFGLAGKAKDVVGTGLDVAGNVVDGIKGLIGFGSPARVFKEIGRSMVTGMAEGLKKDRSAENSAVVQAERIVAAFSKTLSKNPDILLGLDANPVISPVLDLTKAKAGAVALDNLMKMRTITADISLAQARLISTTAQTTGKDDKTSARTGPSEVKFEQNIFSPEALSTNDIYRNTKSQIALAKEELNI